MASGPGWVSRGEFIQYSNVRSRIVKYYTAPSGEIGR
jgi:hypothetical protein